MISPIVMMEAMKIPKCVEFLSKVNDNNMQCQLNERNSRYAQFPAQYIYELR